MRKTYIVAGVASLALTVACWSSAVRAQQETAQKPGEKLEQAGQAIKKGFQKAGDAVREGFAKTRESVHNMGVESRVYGRLHWDKALTTSSLELDVKAGTVTLRGSVPDAAAKGKALTLTQETVGVTQVIDQLTVLPPTRAVPTPPPATLPKP